MAVDFDAHIRYYAYNNTDGDEFGVGMLGSKEDWVGRINRWAQEDGNEGEFNVQDWEELDFQNDFRGVLLAEVEPIDKDYLVTWVAYEDEFAVRITQKGDFIWEQNPKKLTTIPRWLKRCKTTLNFNKVA